MIKIDCQGYEQSIFKGMSGILQDDALRPDAIILEFWPERLRLAGADVPGFTKDLFKLGYEVWDIGSDPILVQKSHDPITSASILPILTQCLNHRDIRTKRCRNHP